MILKIPIVHAHNLVYFFYSGSLPFEWLGTYRIRVYIFVFLSSEGHITVFLN